MVNFPHHKVIILASFTAVLCSCLFMIAQGEPVRIKSWTGTTKFAAVWLPAKFYKHWNIFGKPSDPPSFMEVKVWLVKGKPCIRFESYMEDAGQTVEFAVRGQFLNADTLVFSFEDNWEIKGNGILERVGKNARISFKELTCPKNTNARRNYPNSELLLRVKAKKEDFPLMCVCNEKQVRKY